MDVNNMIINKDLDRQANFISSPCITVSQFKYFNKTTNIYYKLRNKLSLCDTQNIK
jgi:hypothetical protein